MLYNGPALVFHPFSVQIKETARATCWLNVNNLSEPGDELDKLKNLNKQFKGLQQMMSDMAFNCHLLCRTRTSQRNSNGQFRIVFSDWYEARIQDDRARKFVHDKEMARRNKKAREEKNENNVAIKMTNMSQMVIMLQVPVHGTAILPKTNNKLST